METTRLHVNLVPDAASDLEAEKNASGMNGAEVTNRALQLYHYLMEAERNGRTILLKDRATEDLERITIERDKA